MHITRDDILPPSAGTAAEGALSGQVEEENKEDDEAAPKPITCMSYDVEGVAALASFVPASSPSTSSPPRPAAAPPTSRFHYLGGNAGQFLKYLQQELGQAKAEASQISRRAVMDLEAEKEGLAALWREGRLLVEDPHTLDRINNKTSFGELLMTYTHRMQRADEDPLTSQDLRAFLRAEYGEVPTEEATYAPDRRPAEAMAALKRLLEWFKEGFPYYKSTCLHCGHVGPSHSPHPPPAPSSPTAAEAPPISPSQPNHMIGVVAPSPPERALNATLTEIYVCGACGKIYRFPRSVSLRHVLQTRRGRCGEYSRLFFKTTEALGYVSRWVVDWEDHVWVEVRLPGKGWVHLDPCEAAVNEPLLYQGWGKKQTYILAFSREEVEDVTREYTTDWAGALGRRRVSEEEMSDLLACANGVLQGGGERGEGGKEGEGRGGDEKRNAGKNAGQTEKRRRSSGTSPSAGTDTGGKGKGGLGSGGGREGGRDGKDPAAVTAPVASKASSTSSPKPTAGAGAKGTGASKPMRPPSTASSASPTEGG